MGFSSAADVTVHLLVFVIQNSTFIRTPCNTAFFHPIYCLRPTFLLLPPYSRNSDPGPHSSSKLSPHPPPLRYVHSTFLFIRRVLHASDRENPLRRRSGESFTPSIGRILLAGVYPSRHFFSLVDSRLSFAHTSQAFSAVDLVGLDIDG